MTTPKQPTTEAGRALLAALNLADDEMMVADIARIEAEAAAGLLALREAAEAMFRDPAEGADPLLALRDALDRTALAAAEIEAQYDVLVMPPGPEVWKDLPPSRYGTWLNLDSPEAEQRLAAALYAEREDAERERHARAILAELRREQPATEETE